MMKISMRQKLIKKLYDAYLQHGTIILGVDFDNTVFPLDTMFIEECYETVELVKRAMPYSTICLWTVADKWSLVYKVALMEAMGIKAAYVNESFIQLGDGPKPFFNLLLDDSAGLEEAKAILEGFLQLIENTE